MGVRSLALGMIFNLFAGIALAVPVTLTFDATFLGDSVSRGEAGPGWVGPQTFENVPIGDVLSGTLKLNFPPENHVGKPVCTIGNCDYVFSFPRLDFCGRKGGQYIHVDRYSAGRGGSVTLGDLSRCKDETVQLDIQGDKGKLIYTSYPDHDYATDGLYRADFSLSNVRENNLALHAVPAPGAGMLLAGVLVLAAGVMRRRNRA